MHWADPNLVSPGLGPLVLCESGYEYDDDTNSCELTVEANKVWEFYASNTFLQLDFDTSMPAPTHEWTIEFWMKFRAKNVDF